MFIDPGAAAGWCLCVAAVGATCAAGKVWCELVGGDGCGSTGGSGRGVTGTEGGWAKVEVVSWLVCVSSGGTAYDSP